ncbi:MAG: hypothetical protein A2015_09465 [Spirochaetes bacterium GWF1_31_7]|nr:MAG: hypothetical protein A2Y30_01155 [Spirochaetes bacterium GWE1_32_154]OHD45102.1 MAG: hypothetical protein A2Y29_15200 [Spirochaetes bacterium GWE2_31_10]OHD52669.1 MAG: hypothetical protein A2015_09465 [Spirochaetes bacterium GWF1_31_7]
MMGIHDKRYKKIFSNPFVMERFLKSFVHEDFIAKLDFSSMQKIDKEYVSDEYVGTESDIVYKINFEGKEIYIFVLLEFQSTVDKLMCFRFMNYISSLYLDFNKPDTMSKHPAVFPLLLYSGDSNWKYSNEIADLIEDTIPMEYIPHLKYYPVLVNSFAKEKLKDIHNVISAMFYVENSDPEQLSKEVDILLEIIKEENTEVLNAFASWVNSYLSYIGNNDKEEIHDKIEDLQGVKTMFETRLKEYGGRLKKDIESKTATKMLADGFSIDKVAKYTELSIDEIKKLKVVGRV